MSTPQREARTGTPGPRTFESIDGPEAFAALFAPGGKFRDPVTPWTTDLHKVARDTDAIFPDWNQRVDRIRGGGTGPSSSGRGRRPSTPARAKPASRFP